MVRLQETGALALALLLITGCPTDPDEGFADDDDTADDDTADDDTADDDTADDDTADDDDSAEVVYQLDPQRIYDDVAELASDEFGGRYPGTEGNEAALEMGEALFESLGMTPYGDGGGFRQAFEFAAWQQLAPSTLVLDGVSLAEGGEYGVLDYSGSGDVTDDMVFVGYGLTVPAFQYADHPNCPLSTDGYDDYEGVDVTGKIVVVLRHGPADDNDVYSFCPDNGASPSGQGLWMFGYKAANAALHGAEAMILVQNYANGSSYAQGSITESGFDPNFASLSVNRDLMETALPDLADWAQAIDDSMTPDSHATGVTGTVTVSADKEEAETHNLSAAVEGSDPELADEWIVIGGHIDHVGTDPFQGDIYNGADDNASGSAMVMELARLTARGGITPARSVLFQLYNAEEEGLIGSCHYVDNPAHPLGDTVAMLSVDMVGGGDGSGLNLFGAGEPQAAWIAEMMQATAGEALLEYQVVPGEASFNSDHACFAMEGIPAAMALTLGPHDHYHTPQDTIDNIDIDDLEAGARLLWSWLAPLAEGREDDYLSKSSPTAPGPAAPYPFPDPTM